MRGWPRRGRGAPEPPPAVDYAAGFRRAGDGIYRICLAAQHDSAAL